VIPDRGRTWVIAVPEIEWLEAADNYVVVHAGARAPLLRRTLSALLADLGDAFVRTQRGAAVALGQVATVRSLAKGDATVVLKSGAQVPCSRQHRAQLMARLAG
jgi:two-component system LytT family response regulator